MDKETMTTRIRGNFSTTAKGLAQLDITAEAETPEQMEELLRLGCASVMKVLGEQKIKATHEVE